MKHEIPPSTDTERKAIKPTRFDRLMYRIFARDLTALSTEEIAPGFWLITLQSDALRGFSWVPGQKIQVAMGSALVARTYTPIRFDSGSGQFQLIAYAHGAGPGAAWVRTMRPGDVFKVFGPAGSLDLRLEAGSLVMVGDETSIALSVAAAAHHAGTTVDHIFEVHERSNVESVLAQVGLSGSAVHTRIADGSHLDEIERRVLELAKSGADVVLTGNAKTIQRLRHALRRENLPTKKVHTKAYWAEGKTGLD